MLGIVDLNDCYGRLGPRQLALLPWKKGSTLRILAGTTTSEWRRRRWIFKYLGGADSSTWRKETVPLVVKHFCFRCVVVDE